MPIRPENKARYPKDWPLRSRFVRFYRARNLCEWCGARNGEPHPVTGSKVVLTVAHVFDRRPEAASLLNLAALCNACHNRHDAKDRAAGRRARREAGQLRLFPETPLPRVREVSPPEAPAPIPGNATMAAKKTEKKAAPAKAAKTKAAPEAPVNASGRRSGKKK